MVDPIRYAPSLEQTPADEAETIDALIAQFDTIMGIIAEDYGHGARGVHAKGHGIARGTFTVADDLPPELAQGMFATPGDHPAIMRFSTNPGDILDDSIALPRGLGLKLLDVAGARLPGTEGATTQDFVMANGPAFAAANPKAFLANLKLLAATTDRAEWAKKALSRVLQVAEKGLEAIGTESTLAKTLGGAEQTHPLAATYYSQTPYRYGDHVAKFSLKPVDIDPRAADPIKVDGRRDAIREEVNTVLADRGARWEFQVQLLTDPDMMPVEDASVVWDEEQSPFRTVATLTVEPQRGWDGASSIATEDAIAFSPWHGITWHRPLGGINRVRHRVYDFSATTRAGVNGCPIHEPASLAALPR